MQLWAHKRALQWHWANNKAQSFNYEYVCFCNFFLSKKGLKNSAHLRGSWENPWYLFHSISMQRHTTNVVLICTLVTLVLRLVQAGRSGPSLMPFTGQNRMEEVVCNLQGVPRHWTPENLAKFKVLYKICLLYTSPSPRDLSTSRMPSSA